MRNSPRLLWVVVALGALLRLARYLDNRSLWLDEAMLAINVTEKSFSELFGRLEFLQTAPIGFLLAEKSVVSVLGDSEHALRLVPLLASLASLVLFAYVARRLLTPPVALLATGFFAASPRLLYFSSEIKPYSSDVAVALALIALALRANDDRERRPVQRLVPLALVAPVAVWFSFPAILVLGAIAVFLAIGPLRKGDRRQVGAIAALAGVWVASFGVLYAVSSTNVSRTADAVFEGGSSHGSNRFADMIEKSWSIVFDPGGFQHGTNGLAALLLLIGLLALMRDRQSDRIVLLGLPLAIAAVAELLGRYPLGGRFSLFLVPGLVLVVAYGVSAAVGASRRPLVAGSLLAFFLLAPAVGQAAADLASPPRDEDVRPLLGYVSRHWRAGDTLYVYRNAQYAVRYYGSCEDCDPPGSSFPWPTRAAPPSSTGEQFTPALQSAPPRLIVGEHGRTAFDSIADADRFASERVWLLFSHVSKRGLNEESLILAALDERGQVLEERLGSNAALYLYRLTE